MLPWWNVAGLKQRLSRELQSHISLTGNPSTSATPSNVYLTMIRDNWQLTFLMYCNHWTLGEYTVETPCTYFMYAIRINGVYLGVTTAVMRCVCAICNQNSELLTQFIITMYAFQSVVFLQHYPIYFLLCCSIYYLCGWGILNIRILDIYPCEPAG